MKDITLKITGKQISGNEPEEKMEFITEGKMYDKNGSKYIMYEESEFSGFPGCKTALKFSDESIRMKRIGQNVGIGMEFIFEEGKRFSSEYKTPYGTFDMEVLTRSIVGELDSEGTGQVYIDYQVSFNGVTEGRNELMIQVME